MTKDKAKQYREIIEDHLGHNLDGGRVETIAAQEYAFDLVDNWNDVSIKLFHVGNIDTFDEYKRILDCVGIAFIVDAGDAFALCGRFDTMDFHHLTEAVYAAAMASHFILAGGYLWVKDDEEDDKTHWNKLPRCERRSLLEPWNWD